MHTLSWDKLSDPKQPPFWLVLLCCLSISLLLTTSLNISPIFSSGIVVIIISILLINRPTALLGFLMFIRMSLDHLSESVQLSINDSFSLSLSQILGVFLLFVSMLLFGFHFKKLQNFPLWKAFLPLMLFGFLSLIWSINTTNSLQEIARIFSIFSISFLAFISLSNPKDLKKIFLLILLASIIPAIEAMRQIVTGTGLADAVVGTPRPFGTFAHPNTLALFSYSISVVLILLFELQKQHKAPARLLIWITPAFLIFTGILLFTYTRIAWIVFFLFLFCMAVWRYREWLFPLIAIPILAIALVPTVQNRFLESFETHADSSIAWRESMWSDMTTKLHIDGRQYLGTGIDTFDRYTERFRGDRFGSVDAHNDFVKFFVEGGWFGLGLFLLSLFLLTREIHSLWSLPEPYRDLAIIFAFYAGTLFFAMFSDNVFKNTPLLWIFFTLFGALLALKRVIPDMPKKISEER